MLRSPCGRHEAKYLFDKTTSFENQLMSDFATGRSDFPSRTLRLGAEFNAKIGDLWSAVGPEELLGLRLRSFVPALGETVWKLSDALKARLPYSAYIYQLGDGQRIGYVRVPHYNYDESAVSEFANLIGHFESSTVALVFDQVDNPGGSMFYMYSLLSSLTGRPLALPQHQLALNDDDAATASDILELAGAGEAVPLDERPSPHLIAYSRFVLSEIEAGRWRGTLTNPVHLGGVTEVLPSAVHYTKSIVILSNELTFSAGEFLAAILQDNRAATLFGERTAGAGGCARRIVIPGSKQLGIEYITLTWTFARRTNGQSIENLGVLPDVHYSITVEDLQSGFHGYRQALLRTIYDLLRQGSASATNVNVSG